MTPHEARTILESLPDIPYMKAMDNFDEEFFESRQKLYPELYSPGDILIVAFDWLKTEEGYEYWADVWTEYGWIKIE